MGQNLCSNTAEIKNDFRDNYLNFQFGEDQREGKVEHEESIHFKPFLNIEDVVKICTDKLKTSQLLYKDPSLPTQKLILKSMAKQNNSKKQIEAVFERPYKFLNDAEKGKPYKIFPSNDSNRDYILVKDEVMQYLGVFLCFLADHPKIVSDLILTESNSYGFLAVKMNISNKQQIIYMDDSMLCSGGGPLFFQPVKNIYLWPNVLEKAWLKTTGFTERVIERASPEQVFESFLNYPYKKFPLEQLSEQSVRMYLKKYLYRTQREYGYVLTTKKEPKIHIGLSGKKYMYLIGSFSFQDKIMFYIRNPCGRFNFRGQYDQITEELKTKIREVFNIVTIQEGNFVLEESQFIEQISEFSICYYSAQLKTTNLAIQLENNSQILVQTELKIPGNVSLCFRQEAGKRSEAKFSPITYQIFNLTTGELISGQQNMQGCFGLHNAYLFPEVIKKLPQSKYLIRLKKKDKKKHYFGIDSYLIASSATEMKFDIKNQHQFSQLFKENLKKEGSKRLSSSKGSSDSAKKGTINPIEYVVFMAGDLICIYIEYMGQKSQQFKIEISFPELKNLELIYPEMDLKKTSVLPSILGPSNKDEIIIFQKVDLTGQTELGQFELEAF